MSDPNGMTSWWQHFDVTETGSVMAVALTSFFCTTRYVGIEREWTWGQWRLLYWMITNDKTSMTFVSYCLYVFRNYLFYQSSKSASGIYILILKYLTFILLEKATDLYLFTCDFATKEVFWLCKGFYVPTPLKVASWIVWWTKISM